MSTPTKDQIIQELKSILAEAPALHSLDCNRNAHAGPCKCWLAKREVVLRNTQPCNHNSVTVHLTGAACNSCNAELKFDGKSGNWIEGRDDDSSTKSKILEFMRDYQSLPPLPDEAESKLIALAEEYHRRTEEYDRTVCTGPIIRGAIQPASAAEMSLATANARTIRAELTARAKGIGFDMVDLYEKIQITKEFKIRNSARNDTPRFTFERPSR